MAEVVAPLFFNHYLIPKEVHDLPGTTGTRTGTRTGTGTRKKKERRWLCLRPADFNSRNQTSVLILLLVNTVLCTLMICTLLNIGVRYRNCEDDHAADGCKVYQMPEWLWMIRILMTAVPVTLILAVLACIPLSPLAYAGLFLVLLFTFMALVLPLFTGSSLDFWFVLILFLLMLLGHGYLLKIFVETDREIKLKAELERMETGEEKNDLIMSP